MPNKVNANMNDQLNQASIVEEIIVVLNQMLLTKTLGPDGLPDVFFQKHCKAIS